MNQLKVTGTQKIGEHEFTGIEGGFGKGKKALLVKDIAVIHGQSVGNVNLLINRNRKWFEDGVDIIDLKSDMGLNHTEKQIGQNNLFSDYGFTKAQWGNSNNIYVLSEQGYSNLLKILEDDKAWTIYKKFVKDYFGMRKAIKESNISIAQSKRLEIMEDNAKTRKANLLYKIAMATKSETSKERLLAEAGKAITGEMVLPIMKQKEYSAGDVARIIGNGLTANRVGRIAKSLGLKAEQPGQNEFGRWSNSKSQHSLKEVPQWLYFNKGLGAIKKEFLKYSA